MGLGIAQVGIAAYAEHGHAYADGIEACSDELVLAAVLDGRNLLQDGTDGCGTFTVEAHAVHRKAVERPDLLSERPLGLGGGSLVGDDLVDALLVQFVEIDECAVHGMFCVERMRLQPSAGCVLVEIVAGTYVEVHVGLRVLCEGGGGKH